ADEETVPVTSIRRTIAQRMTASAFSAPAAWLVVESDVTGLVALRNAQKEAFRQRHGIDLTYLPFVAHAVAQSLLEHPYLNASWAEDKIILRKRVNLGIAVPTGRDVPLVRSPRPGRPPGGRVPPGCQEPARRTQPRHGHRLMPGVCEVHQLGLVDYEEAWAFQRELAGCRAADEIPDTLLLLEHPPVYTTGKRNTESNL